MPGFLETGSKPAPGRLVLVQAFVNTVDLEHGGDDFATPGGLAAWLRHHQLLDPDAPANEPVSEAERQRAVAFREALRALLRAHAGEALDPRAVATLQGIAADTPLTLRYDASGEAVLDAAVGGVAGSLARLQALVYDAVRDGSWGRLKACLNPECRWAFYDASRNRSGSWCSMEVCGNRMKVRAHRRRARTPEHS